MYIGSTFIINKGDLGKLKFNKLESSNAFGLSVLGNETNLSILFSDFETLDSFAELIEQQITAFQVSQDPRFNNEIEITIDSYQGGTSHFE